MSAQFFFALIPLSIFTFLLFLYLMRIASYDRRKNHTRATLALPSYDQVSDSFSLCTIKIKDKCFRARIHNLQGRGDAIILLHGWPQSSLSWQPFFDATKDLDYKIIAFDQRGYSPGARPNDIQDYTTDKLVEDVFSIADELNIHRFHLAGHDWGAAIGWAAVMSQPKRILSWTALSIPHSLAFFEALRVDKEQKKKSRYIILFGMRWLPELLLMTSKFFVLRSIIFRWMPKLHKQEYLTILSEPGALTATLNWYRAIGMSKKFHYNPDIKLPVLFIWGNRDPAISKQAITLQDQYIKGVYKKIELDAGHWLLERRSKLVVRNILKHIANATKD